MSACRPLTGGWSTSACLTAKGRNLSKNVERGIERIFFREDFRRVYLDEIGTIDYAPGVIDTYTDGFLEKVDVQAIAAAGFSIVADYAYAPSAEVLSPILTELGVEVVPLSAHVDGDKMSVSREAFEKSHRQLALITGALDTNLGVRLDVGGEKVFLVDHHGRKVPDIQAAAAMATLVLRASPGSSVVVPVNMPSFFEEIAEHLGGKVKRCKVDPQSTSWSASTGKGW